MACNGSSCRATLSGLTRCNSCSCALGSPYRAAATGRQNPRRPTCGWGIHWAKWRCTTAWPVVLGPHTFNFAEAAELACAAGAAQRVPDMAAGMAVATDLATVAAQQAAASERATLFATAHRGAARATVQAILEIVQTDSR